MIDVKTGWYAVPATIKAVVVTPDRRALVLRNERTQWELPGGWPSEHDTSMGDVLRREISEETGLTVEVGRLLHAELVVVAGEQRVIVAYRCDCADAAGARTSDEHSAHRWVDAEDLLGLELEAYATAIRLALAD